MHYVLYVCYIRGLSMVPKANEAQYMKENMDIFDFTLTDEEMLDLSLLSTPGGEGDASGNDGTSMMCHDLSTGKMTRCLYLDADF